MKVIIAGAGTLGRRVALYIKEHHEVVIIERDEARANAIREEVGEKVLNGDADEPSTLLEAGADTADVFLAATGDDEDNLVACLLAKNEFKIKKVISAVRNPRNRWLFNRSWGIDVALDSGQIAARIIEEEATLTDLVRLLDLREGEVTVSSVTATADGSMAGKTFSQLHVPRACYPAAILRGSAVIMPAPDVKIEVGDTLLIIAGPGGECNLEELG
ncbi:MAG: potassium channel family protein [Thermoleophilia bacterium]